MSSTSTASSRNCPVCDAPNSNLSQFCAECGASLNAPESDDTAAFQPLTADRDEDDAQRTAAFRPEPYGRGNRDDPELTDSSRVTPDATSSYGSAWQPTSAAPAAAVPLSVDPVWSTTADAYAAAEPAPLGMRGFVLGVVAVLLMLVVFLLWTWATLLDAGARDSIRDLFGFIG